LVVREVPMEAVDLVPGENAEQLLDFSLAVELTGNIEMKAAPSHGWFVADLAFDRKTEGVRIKVRTTPDLAKRDQAIEQASLRAGGNVYDLAREGHAIGFWRQALDDVKHHGQSSFRGRADDPFDRKELFDE